MDFSILAQQAVPIPTHAYAAFACIVIGGVQLSLSKGGTRHIWLGRLWVGLLAYVALSSFFINEINILWGFSYIHILSVITLVSLYTTVQAARKGRIAAHRRGMKQLYLLALIITGLFTFLPDRTMHQVLFGG